MRDDGSCIACDCNPVGSKLLQCNSEGKCQCKPGVTGDKCDKCEPNHYDFGAHGCKNCGCSEIGSINNTPSCDPYTGTCYCKENVEGKRCRECKPGFFNLDKENTFGCTPCFCYGHSSQCISASGYFKHRITSRFDKSADRWRILDNTGRPVDLNYDPLSQSISFRSLDNEVVYFVAPDRYLGDQRASYNQVLQFTLRIGKNMALPSAADVIIEGAGERIALTIFAQQHSTPTIEVTISSLNRSLVLEQFIFSRSNFCEISRVSSKNSFVNYDYTAFFIRRNEQSMLISSISNTYCYNLQFFILFFILY